MRKTLTICCALLIAGASFTACTKKGATGPQGNANVKDSTYNTVSWFAGTNYYYTILAVPGLTADIQNNGAVLVYMGKTGGTSWIQLPYTDPTGAQVSVTTTLGDVEMEYYTNTMPTYNSFKVVVIASAQLAKSHISRSTAQYLSYDEAVSIASGK